MTVYRVRRFLRSAPGMPRPHWNNVLCTRSLERAATVLAQLNADPAVIRGGIFTLDGKEVTP